MGETYAMNMNLGILLKSYLFSGKMKKVSLQSLYVGKTAVSLDVFTSSYSHFYCCLHLLSSCLQSIVEL